MAKQLPVDKPLTIAAALAGAAGLGLGVATGSAPLMVFAGSSLGGIFSNLATDACKAASDHFKLVAAGPGAPAQNHDLTLLAAKSIAAIVEDARNSWDRSRGGHGFLKAAARITPEQFKDSLSDPTFASINTKQLTEFLGLPDGGLGEEAATESIWYKLIVHTLKAANPEGDLATLHGTNTRGLVFAARRLWERFPAQFNGELRNDSKHGGRAWVAFQSRMLRRVVDNTEAMRADWERHKSEWQVFASRIELVLSGIADGGVVAVLDPGDPVVVELHQTRNLVGSLYSIMRVVEDDVRETKHDVREIKESLAVLVATERAAKGTGVVATRTADQTATLESGLRSRDPAIRRVALLANRELSKARVAHELAKTQHADRPSDDARTRAQDVFLDVMFEGDMLRAEGRPEDALPQYARACELEPDDTLAAVALVEANTDYMYWRGPELPRPSTESLDAAMTWRDQAQRSLELLVEAVFHKDHDTGSPTLLPAAWALARFAFESYVHLGDRVPHYSQYKDKSRKALERAEKGSPDHPITLRLLGRHWWRLEGDPERANQYFARAVEQEPGTVGARLYYALSLVEQGRDREATELFEASLDIDPDDPNVLGAYGDFLARDPATEAQAERMWRHAVSVWPEHRAAWYSLIRFLSTKPGRVEDSEAVFVSAIKARPGDVSLLEAYSDSLAAAPGREDEAHEVNLRIRDLRPTSTDTLIRLMLGALACGKVTGDATAAGLHLYNDGVKKQERLLMLGGAWIGVLYGASETHPEALRAIKQIVQHASTPPEFPYLNNPACLRQVKAAGHPYSEWLEPLALVLAGGQTADTLTEWEAWSSLPVS
jgi:tetratricopeptide (TPR) repeat protein